ncbi:MAG: inositol monophosphatase [Fimbriimonadia bacterium]|nr:inositol monophosphatase [Fimbriimonadia bacterium]
MSLLLSHDPSFYLARLKSLHVQMRDHLRRYMLSQDPATLAAVGAEHDGDTQYRIDEQVESLLISLCREWAEETPFVLIAEGISDDGWLSLPEGKPAQEAEFLLIVDPIDGTRPLMYDKRSAWMLSGIAPNFGKETTLEHICLAVQTELPTSRQGWAYQMWASRGQGARAERHELATGRVEPALLQPSRASDLKHGFASFVKFFPEGKLATATLESEFWKQVFGDSDKPLAFEDQYASTGGQLFELMSGHDRFVADIRPWAFRKEGLRASTLTCHPYDICTALITEELGVQITDLKGRPLRASLDTKQAVGWLGYANVSLRESLEPVLMELLWGG